MFDADTQVVTKTIDMAGKAIAMGAFTNGVSVLDNGNLLFSDYNGDGIIINDYLFEFNPDTETLVNYLAT